MQSNNNNNPQEITYVVNHELPNGDIYSGKMNNNGQKHGKGVLICPNGDVLDGEFKDGKKHGKMFITFSNGYTCKGEFRNGLMNDTEILIRKCDGTVEKGGVKDGMIHGKIITTDASGFMCETIYDNGWLVSSKNITPDERLVEPEAEAIKEDFNEVLAYYAEVKPQFNLLKLPDNEEGVNNLTNQSQDNAQIITHHITNHVTQLQGAQNQQQNQGFQRQ